MRTTFFSLLCIIASVLMHGTVVGQDSLPADPAKADGDARTVEPANDVQAPAQSGAVADTSDVQPATETMSWRLQLLCEKTAIVFKDIDTDEKYNVRPGTQGVIISARKGRIEFTCIPRENEEYLTGAVVLHADSVADSIYLSSYDGCDSVLMEPDAGAKIVRCTVIPARVHCRLTLRTGIVDYTMIRTDENGEISDTFFNMEAEHLLTLKRKHNYDFQLAKPGFDPYSFKLTVASDVDTSITQFRRKSLGRMVALSLMFPGTGQYYGDRPKPGCWYRVLALSFLGITALDGAVAGISKLTYNRYNESYAGEPDADKREKIRESRSSAKRMFYRSRSVLYGSAGVLGVIWTINIVDPLFFSIGNNTRLN